MSAPAPFVRLASRLFATLGLVWVLILAVLTMIGHHPVGPCGRALPVTPEHRWAIGIAVTTLLLNRMLRSLGRADAFVGGMPVISAAIILWLATEALLTPHAHCGPRDVDSASWWSAWHHFVVLGLQIAVGVVGGRRRQSACA